MLVPGIVRQGTKELKVFHNPSNPCGEVCSQYNDEGELEIIVCVRPNSLDNIPACYPESLIIRQ